MILVLLFLTLGYGVRVILTNEMPKGTREFEGWYTMPNHIGRSKTGSEMTPTRLSFTLWPNSPIDTLYVVAPMWNKTWTLNITKVGYSKGSVFVDANWCGSLWQVGFAN